MRPNPPSLFSFTSFNLLGKALPAAVQVFALILLMFAAAASVLADSVVGWGDNSNNQTAVPAGLTDATAISAGGGHNIAVRSDGTVVMWGYNPFGQLDVPAGLGNVVAASAGYDHTLALRGDGTVVSWGRNSEGQTNVPPGLNGVAAVSANGHHSLVLKTDGTVLAWGENGDGQGTVPAGLTDVTAISAGPFHNLALRRDGTVIGWGRNDNGQSTPPAGLTGVIAIAAGGEHSLALKSDGTVVAWGRNNYGQNDVAAGLSDVIAIATGFAHSIVLRTDGSVVARGWNDFGQATVPAGLSGARGIAAGFQHSLAQVGQGSPRPVIVCPADVSLPCTNCITEPSNTGMATATGSGQVRIGYSDAVSGDCPKLVTRTWTATDDSGASASCVQRISCVANDMPPTNDVPPTIVCPRDVVLTCAGCNTDPANTGVATATDDGPVQITYTDLVSGECPKVVTRTWTATDEASNAVHCVQTITCVPPSVVTDSAWCVFDRDPGTPEQEFRLLFTQDPKRRPCLRLNASNPGQFRYNVFQTGTPGQELTFNLTLPYPFVTQGTRPIKAYDWVSVLWEGSKPCFVPGSAFFSSAQRVTLANYGALPDASTAVSVTVTVPDSGVVFLSLHLDYGLKRRSGFSNNAAGDAVDCATGLQALIPNQAAHVFSVSGGQDGSSSIRNVNEFKGKPGAVGGLVRSRAAGDPVSGTLVTLATAKGVFIGTRLTDEDGYFEIPYQHTGKAAGYAVSILTPDGYRQTKAVTLKADSDVQLEFQVP